MSDEVYTLDEVKEVLREAGHTADELSGLMHRYSGELQGYHLFGGDFPNFPFFEAMHLADRTARRLDVGQWKLYRLDNDE